MKKRIIYILLIFIILTTVVFSLTGCGEISDDNGVDEENVENEEIQNQEEEQSIGACGSFVKYKDNVYYWKLTANSRESTALFANYNDMVTANNFLIKRDKDGNEQTLITDKGSEDIYILNDKIFLSYAIDEYGTKRKIYSIDLNGENKVEYQQGEMKYIIGDYIICQTQNGGDIFRINSKNGQIENLKTNANIFGCAEDIIYYTESYDYEVGTLKIGSIKDNKDNGIIATVKTSDFDEYSLTPPIEVTKFWYENNKINMYVGYRLGTANILQEVILLTMDKDGENLVKEKNSIEVGEDDSELEQLEYDVYVKSVEKNGTYYNDLMYIDQNTGESKELITEEEIKERYSFIDNDEHYISLYSAKIIDDEAYVVLDYTEHYPSEDIGWRYSYKRLKTVCFKYNTKTNEITDIYNF